LKTCKQVACNIFICNWKCEIYLVGLGAFHRFGQAKLAFGSLILGSCQFPLLPLLLHNNNLKIIILLPYSKFVTHSIQSQCIKTTVTMIWKVYQNCWYDQRTSQYGVTLETLIAIRLMIMFPGEKSIRGWPWVNDLSSFLMIYMSEHILMVNQALLYATCSFKSFKMFPSESISFI